VKAKIPVILFGCGGVMMATSLWFGSPPQTRLDAPNSLSVPGGPLSSPAGLSVFELVSPPQVELRRIPPPQTWPQAPHSISPPAVQPIPEIRIHVRPAHPPRRLPGYILPELAGGGPA